MVRGQRTHTQRRTGKRGESSHRELLCQSSLMILPCCFDFAAHVLLNPGNGVSRGAGFIEFSSAASARAALDEMSGKLVSGELLHVEFAVLKGNDPNVHPDRLHFSGVPQHKDALPLLRASVEKYGRVTEVILSGRPDPRGFVGAFVQFESATAAQAAHSGLDHSEFFSQLLPDDAPPITTNVSFARRMRSEPFAPRGGARPPGERFPDICRFFGSQRGCKEGNACRFIHPAPASPTRGRSRSRSRERQQEQEQYPPPAMNGGGWMDPMAGGGGGGGMPYGGVPGFGGLPFPGGVPDGSMAAMAPMSLPMPPMPMPAHMMGMGPMGGMGQFDPSGGMGMPMQMGGFNPMAGAPFMQQQQAYGGMQQQQHQQQQQQQQQQPQQLSHEDQMYADLPAPNFEQ